MADEDPKKEQVEDPKKLSIEEINRIKDRKRLAWEGMFYSMQRIDLLLVALCGGGIYVCLETIKYLSEKDLSIHLLIKISGFLFLVGIITNLLSQFFGHETNFKDYLWCDSQLDGDSPEDCEKYDKESDWFSQLTTISNYTSLFFTGLGLAIILVYFAFIF